MVKVLKQISKEYLTEYSTTPTVEVHSPAIVILYFTLVITAFCMYLASIDFNVRKIYQKECDVHGIVLTEIDGQFTTEYLSDEDLNMSHPHLYKKAWDSKELVFPEYGGEEEGSFTIVTNMIITPNQTWDTCDELKTIKECEEDKDCPQGYVDKVFKNILTGKCVQETGKCEVKGWCPPHNYHKFPRNKRKPLLEGVYNFTVWLRSYVDFPDCNGQKGTNLPNEFVTAEECFEDPKCLYFRLSDIIKKSNTSFNNASIDGHVIRIHMIWDCDFDWGKNVTECFPEYKFDSIDYDAPGIPTYWGFWRTHYYSNDRRDLKQMYGLKFLINVEGKGRQFDFFTFIITVGASTGLLAVAPFVCDLILSLYGKLGKSGSLDVNDTTLPVDVTQLKAVDLPNTFVQFNREMNK